jgi:hypothetical protein
VYSLDYDMMVQVLQQFRYSGEVHANMPLQAKIREEGRVILMVYNGVVRSCFILSRKGQKLYHDVETQRILSKVGVLEWELVPFTSPQPTESVHPPPIAQASSPDNGARFCPRRLTVSQTQMRTWSVLQRSVYLLSDGIRDQAQIATLLSRPLNIIEQTISQLQQLGAIQKW